MAVDRPLELGLKEHVIRLPPGYRRSVGIKAQQRLAVGSEPLIVVDRDHLAGQHIGETQQLHQAHDLVIEMHRAR
jgi:hypothetical protein